MAVLEQLEELTNRISKLPDWANQNLDQPLNQRLYLLADELTRIRDFLYEVTDNLDAIAPPRRFDLEDNPEEEEGIATLTILEEEETTF